MREELLETEAVEMPALDDGDPIDAAARPLPARVEEPSEISVWRGDVRTAALAAAGGLVAGAATVAVVRATRGSSGRRPAKRSRPKQRPVNVVASRSFLVDVHVLGDR
jgi:hypothetical protein